MKTPLALLLVVPFLGGFSQESKAPGKTPVPEAVAVAEAKKLIKDLYKEDYAKKAPADRGALAVKLRTQARTVANDPVTQFAIYSEAQNLFQSSGELDSCLSAIDEMVSIFAVEACELKAPALTAFAKLARTPDEARKIAREEIKLSDAAIKADQLAIAEKALQDAAATARKIQDATLATLAVSKSKELVEIMAQFEKTKKARELLTTAPEDAAANLAVGHYQCFIRATWAPGLPLLAKGADEALKTFAAQDLAASAAAPSGAAPAADPAAQMKAGDGWWGVSEKETGLAKFNLRQRALQWYLQAEPKLQGLDKAKIDKRILDGHLDRLSQWTWLNLSDPGSFGIQGKKGDSFDVVWEGSTGAHVLALSPFPQGTFDGWSVHLTLNATAPSICTFAFEQKHKAIELRPGQARTMVTEDPTQKINQTYKGTNFPSPGKLDWWITVLGQGKDWAVYIDGIEVTRLDEPKETVFASFEMWAAGRMKVEQLRFRRR